MKIQCVRTHHLRCRLDKPFGFSQWSYDQRNVLLVEVITDSGDSGWGECYGPAEVIQAAVTSFYAPRLIGADPSRIDVLWHTMWRASLDFARGGVMMAAMSGVDMALWDLKGRVSGLSVSELMGGRYRDRVPCYATGMYFKEMPEAELIDALLAEAVAHREEGFSAMKIKIGKNPAFDEKLIAAMRCALPDTTLMADANHAYDLPEAVRVGRALGEHGYTWFEEPLSPEHPQLYAQLHNKLDVALATGESDQTRYGFARLLAAGAVQFVQPDLAYCGGPGEAMRIRTVASAHGVNVVPHVWGTMLNLAAATHFLASGYHEPGRAEDGNLMLEFDRTPNPLRDELFTTPVEIDGAGARVPDAPGLGVTVDPDALKAMRINETEVR